MKFRPLAESSNTPGKAIPRLLAVIFVASSLLVVKHIDPSKHIRRASVSDKIHLDAGTMPICDQNPYAGALEEPLEVITDRAAMWMHNISAHHEQATK